MTAIQKIFRAGVREVTLYGSDSGTIKAHAGYFDAAGTAAEGKTIDEAIGGLWEEIKARLIVQRSSAEETLAHIEKLLEE